MFRNLFNRKNEGYKTADIYREMRDRVLALDPASIGLIQSGPNQVWGALMETGHPEAVSTLVVLGDGTVSLYFSNGGGIIGLGQHEGPRVRPPHPVAALRQGTGRDHPGATGEREAGTVAQSGRLAAHLEHDLALDLVLLQHLMRLRGVGKRQHGLNRRLHYTFVNQPGDLGKFLRVIASRVGHRAHAVPLGCL